jgi:ComF family protein
MLAAATNALVRVFLAPVCAACEGPLDRPLEGPVCQACWRAVPAITPPWCARCGDALPAWRLAQPLCPRCRRRPPRLALTRSAGRYDGSMRNIVHAFKYGRCRLLAEPLGALMRDAGADVLAGADAVVPVPLHPWRSWDRGFNQADDLARQLGLPVWRVLRRRRRGRPQAGLPASRRHANVRDAFGLAYGVALAGRLSGRLHGGLHNRTLVLVDDVMTTGATLEACAKVLMDGGVRAVRALTAARAVTARPPRPLPPHRPSPVRHR